MGQILHGSATTTHAIRAAIQRSEASVQELSERYGINPKTVRKWRKRSSVEDAPMGPRERRSMLLSPEEEAMIVAFRKHTLLPLDDWRDELRRRKGPKVKGDRLDRALALLRDVGLPPATEDANAQVRPRSL